MTTAPHNVITLYKEWINSVLCETGLQIRSISDLLTFSLLPRLYTTLRNTQAGISGVSVNYLNWHSGDYHEYLSAIENILRQLRLDGIRISLQPSDLANGDLHSLLELLWVLLLNYTIYSPDQERVYQRTQSTGSRLLLQWCSELLGGACFDYRLSITENMEKDILHNIINKITGLVSKPDEPEPCDYHEAIADAEKKLGISSNILRASDSHTEDLAVTVYISLLRRKRELINRGQSPCIPCTLVNQQSRACSSPLNKMSERNDIEKQLGLFQLDNSMSSLLTTNALLASHTYYRPQATGDRQTDRQRVCSVGSDDGSMAESDETLSKVPTTSSSTDHQLKLDLQRLSSSHSTTHIKPNAKPTVSLSSEQCSESANFSELFKQIKEQESHEMTEELNAADSGLTIHTDTAKDSCKGGDDDESTSPKSAPTDEGFGTYTKTTPRDNDSRGSDSHTDCDVDQLEESCSITEWWDRIELPTEVATSDIFKPISRQEEITAEMSGNGSIEMMEDELMFMMDNIALTGMKASSSLASAQETELRLLRILKERDDLVLSYHTALKELSKLTARIKDENHMLRRQLDMTDLSHSEIVLALEEQASDGRQLALSLQDDLTDTEMNVVARLRGDKRLLEERLANLEYQYNADISKWKTELSLYKSIEPVNTNGPNENFESLMKENEELREQLGEVKKMFEVTISQTQDECSSYLATIDQLRSQINQSKSPITETQIDALAKHQAETEKLYESIIASLETDNFQMQKTLEDLQCEVDRLNEMHNRNSVSVGIATSPSVKVSKAVSAGYDVVDKECGTQCSLANKSTLTDSNSRQSISTETGEDSRIIQMKHELGEIRLNLSRVEGDNQNLLAQGVKLAEENKQYCVKLKERESEVSLALHKLGTLQAVHDLVLAKNEYLERTVNEGKQELSSLSSEFDETSTQLTADLERSKTLLAQQSVEVTDLKQQVNQLKLENASYKQQEVDLNSELTNLTLERSNLQGRVNALNCDLVQQKSHNMTTNVKLKQMENENSKLEADLSRFKNDTLQLLNQLESSKQEKDDLDRSLSSLHENLSQSVMSWRDHCDQQTRQYEEKMERLHAEVSSEKDKSSRLETENVRLSAEVKTVERLFKEVKEQLESNRTQLNQVLKTAKLDSSSENALKDLNEQFKSLKQQVAEFQFTTAHFRTENSQLQLRVNQLEGLNKSVSQRNAILQKELSTVQASLDDSFMSQDEQLNILDVSMSELNSLSDVSDMKNYLVAARKQVETMQNKRTKTNLEYSRKIFEMEKLLQDKESTDIRSPHASDIRYPSPAIPSNGAGNILKSQTESSSTPSSLIQLDDQVIETKIAVPQPVNVSTPRPWSLDNLHAVLTPTGSSHTPDIMSSSSHSSSTVHPSSIQTTSTSISTAYQPLPDPPQTLIKPSQSTRILGTRATRNLPATHSKLPPPVDDQSDPLSAKVRLLIDGLDSYKTSAPSKEEVHLQTNSQPEVRQEEQADSIYLSSIERENAALKAELNMINDSKQSLHQRLVQQDEKHDVLNDTLEELERSLEEIHDSNKLLRDTLQRSNSYLKTQFLEPKSSTSYSPSGYYRTSSPKTSSHQSTSNPAQLNQDYPIYTNGTSSLLPHSSSGAQFNSMASSPNSHSDSGAEKLYGRSTYGKTGWSADGDKQLTSSADFNKLQQTNVQNYESMLNSSTNARSPNKHNTSARRSTDLNQMIKHSLSQINQINSISSCSPFSADATIHNGLTSTPVKSSWSSINKSSSTPKNYAETTDTNSRDQYFTASQFSVAADEPSGRDVRLLYSPPRPVYNGTHGTHGINSCRLHKTRVYDDGGPGPDEPKAVLPDPPQNSAISYSTDTE